ncbi:MAG: T9SS type A sorting domain-containing protein [candidate division Zixibacteria bacterium]|nr:T9SS type A sorting domain-containing protein [candidate division Zixibacteria bacterium]
MKKIVLTLIIALLPAMLAAQTFISEDFSGAIPPAGWSVDAHPTNWHSGASSNAGGAAPELVFDWSPQFNGMSRFISPEIDLTGVTSNLKAQFSHMVDHYGGAYTIGVATRSSGGSWSTVWQIANPSGNVGPITVLVDIDNSDVGASDFQICWFFTGSSFNVDYWYIDDASLFVPLDHDARVNAINVNSQYEPGATVLARVEVCNFGTNAETFDANCVVNLADSEVYNETITSITLGPGEAEIVVFPGYVASAENELFEVVASVDLDGDEDPSNDTKNAWFNTYTTEREMVLLEIGTGTWCTYCPGAAMGAEDMVDFGHDVAVVEYHNGDPFANVYSNARNTYYGISGFPTAVFDGVEKVVGGSHDQSMYSTYLPIYEERKPINSAFTIDIHGENEGNNYDLTVLVNKMANIAWENMVLHVALTESDISYNWQGQNHLDWVERLMVPDQYGTTIEFSSSDNLAIDLSFTFNTAWEYENCEITAFIQNLDDQEILQGTKVMLPDLTPTAIDDETASLPLTTRLGNNYPNPFNPTTTLNFSLKQAGGITLEIYNVMGQKINTLVDGQLDAGHHSVVWDGKNDAGVNVSSGVYFYKLTTDDYSSSRQMTLIK